MKTHSEIVLDEMGKKKRNRYQSPSLKREKKKKEQVSKPKLKYDTIHTT